MSSPPAFRSFLFVPGSRPDRFDRALEAGADIVCVDLEDAVAAPEKPAARAAALAFLGAAAAGPPLRAVRLNALRSAAGIADLAALLEQPPAGSGLLVLPKVEDAEEIRLLDAVLGEVGSALRLVALIETLRGLDDAAAIAQAAPRMAGLLFGGIDLAAELGVPPEAEALRHARAVVAHAAHRAGIEALDVPCLDVRDLAINRAEAALARGLGFTGKAAIHPGQIPAIHEVFTPSAAEVAEAERVMQAFRASGSGLAMLDGKLVEKPVVRRMERILARAGRQNQPADRQPAGR